MDACSPKPRILLQGLADELQVRIGQTRAQCFGTVESLRFDGTANRIGMHSQFSCNGSDLPMLGVKVAANLRTRLRTDHQVQFFPHRGILGKGSTKRPCRPQTMQQRKPVWVGHALFAASGGVKTIAAASRAGIISPRGILPGEAITAEP